MKKIILFVLLLIMALLPVQSVKAGSQDLGVLEFEMVACNDSNESICGNPAQFKALGEQMVFYRLKIKNNTSQCLDVEAFMPIEEASGAFYRAWSFGPYFEASYYTDAELGYGVLFSTERYGCIPAEYSTSVSSVYDLDVGSTHSVTASYSYEGSSDFQSTAQASVVEAADLGCDMFPSPNLEFSCKVRLDPDNFDHEYIEFYTGERLTITGFIATPNPGVGGFSCGPTGCYLWYNTEGRLDGPFELSVILLAVEAGTFQILTDGWQVGGFPGSGLFYIEGEVGVYYNSYLPLISVP